MNIVIALDGSAESLEATRKVAWLPWATKPAVTVVTALASNVSKFLPASVSKELQEAELRNAREVFELASESLRAKCESVKHVVQREHPRQLIIEVAERVDADMIVLGAKGHSAVFRAMLGSTADYVVNHAKCSVLVARDEGASKGSESDGFRLLLAYDGSPESVEAYRQLCSQDWPPNRTQLRFSMILDRPKLLPDEVVYDPPRVAESEGMLCELALPMQRYTDVTYKVRESLHIGNAICTEVENNRSHLLFVGGTGKSSVARLFLGSTARFVLHHSRCSVWVARRKHWHRAA